MLMSTVAGFERYCSLHINYLRKLYEMSATGKLKESIALVTGGASGLGLATVERLAREGAKVVIFDLPHSNGANIAQNIGSRALFVPGDVTKETDIKAALDCAIKKFGKLNILINCAGIGAARLTYDQRKDIIHPLDEFQYVNEVNVTGTFNFVRLAAQRMASNIPNSDGERGVIVNTASIAAFDGQRGQVAYAASKGAIISMTLPLSRDLASLGIRVVTIAPGIFETPLIALISEKQKSQLVQVTPFPSRSGKPDEFAHLVQCIVENPFINGETIRLDGALRMMM